MSVNASSTTAASSRLSRAISAAKPAPSSASTPELETQAPASKKTTAKAKPVISPALRDAVRGATATAARGASAAPDHAATGANAAGDGADQASGADQLMGSGQPGTSAYAADSPSVMGGGDQAPEPIEVSGGTATTYVEGTGAWSPDWQRRFEKLQLAPADVEYLANAGYDDPQLGQIANELEGVEPVSASDDRSVAPAPHPGVDAGSVASANGPLDPGATAWSPEWQQKFSDVMQRMGMSSTEIREQIATVDAQPVTEEQLQVAYEQMEQSIGAFDDEWSAKFTKIMTELDTPADEQKQVLEQLAGSGLDESKLTEAYTQMENSRPGWNAEYESKFKSLQVPEEMITQLKESKAPASMLDEQFKKLVDTKMEYKNDGRLKKLEDADATGEEKWGVMLQGTDGKDFDKIVEQIHSSHVPAWKRIGSFALNLIPGVYAVQYLTGKDWVTGDKIDRTNPLNIIGAVASGFAGFTAVRSAIAGVQGLSAAGRAATATMQAASASKGVTGLAASVEAMGSASALGKGSFQAIEAAGLISKFEKGLKFTDYLKSAVPIVNRFGEAGRLSAVGRGYSQWMQLASGTGALKSIGDGRVAVDQAAKATMLGELKQGHSVADALGAARATSSGGKFAVGAQTVARDANRFGFLQGGAGKLAEGNRVLRGSGNFKLNPFKSTATIAETANPNVMSLGRGVNFASNGGLAQGLGVMKGANSVANPGLYAQAAQRATGANSLMNGSNASKMAGLSIADDVQRIETMTKTAEWARKLGVTDGGRFRSLLQLGGSARTAQRVAGIVERGGETGYRVGRHAIAIGQKYGSYASVGIVGGSAVGMTGKQMQPMWDYVKNRKEIQAQEREQHQIADTEAAELERLYAEQHGGAAPQPTPGVDAGAATGAGASSTEPQVVGTSPSGSQMVYFPEEGVVVDQGNGDIYDPNTQQVIGNLVQQQGGQAATPAPAPAPAASAPAASAPAATTGGGEQQVYVDPQTGYYVDPQTGMMADPASGQVYDTQGNVVGNVNAAA